MQGASPQVAPEPRPALAKQPREALRPAFANDRQAAAFLLLIALWLVMPVLLARLHPQGRPYVYRAMRESDGAFSFVSHEIFDVKDNLDIVFTGNSSLWAAIDTPYMEGALTRKLGRKARVVTFGSYWPGMDVPYMEIRDALERKRIGMVVIAVPRTEFNDGPSPVGYRFRSYEDPPETTAGLSRGYRIALYAGFVLRSPRDVLESLRPSQSIPSEYTGRNGGWLSEQGFYKTPFVPFTASVPGLTAAAMTWSREARNSFEYTGETPPPYQMLYLRKLADLLRARHVKFAFASIPILEDRRRGAAVERACWPALLGPNVELLGVASNTLFGGLSDADTKKLFFDDVHLNKNGAELYTRTLAPAFLELYGDNANGR